MTRVKITVRVGLGLVLVPVVTSAVNKTFFQDQDMTIHHSSHVTHAKRIVAKTTKITQSASTPFS